MRRIVSVLAGAVLLAGPAMALASPTRTAPALPAALPGTGPLVLRGAVDVGPVPAQARQQVVLALALRNRSGLTTLLADQNAPGSGRYHSWLTPTEFTARFGPTPAAVARAVSWARTAGLTVSDVSANRTLVTVQGSAVQLNRAFGVRLQVMRVAGHAYVTPDRAARLPADLRTATAAVLGLTTYNPNARPLVTATRSGYQPYGLAAYGPQDFNMIYHAPSGTTGSGQTVAVITQGNLTGVAHDLALFQTRNHLPHVGLTVIQTTKTSSDTSGANEYDLDTQYATGFAPGVRALLAYNSDTLGDVHPLNRFVTDRRALTASASYGGCELISGAVGEVAADDQVFEQAQAQGQTFWVSTGDEGSACALLVNTGTPAGLPDVEYPASSPYVVAVGGTTLTGQVRQPTREVGWLGGGGGYSVLEAAPAWQKSSGVFVSSVGRGVPDVSLDADPNSGYVVVVKGSDTAIGGTSASAPAWNGIWARVLQRHPALGFAAPVLYRANAGSITDITLGSNGFYAATPGYDLSTGLGSADITRLVQTAH